MAQRTVWLRRDPVGSSTVLPSRAEFRARFARRSLSAGAAAIVALAVLAPLRALSLWEGLWAPLGTIALILAIAGIAAAAVALRAPELRARALGGFGVSLAAFAGALFVNAIG